MNEELTNEELTNEYENDEFESEEQEVQETEAESSEEATESETPSSESSDQSGDDQDWGFEPKKKKLTKEVLLGFLAIAVLVGVFGVVVMKKINGDGEKFAGTPKQDKGDDKKKDDPFDDSKKDSNVAKKDDDTKIDDSIFNQGEPTDDQDTLIVDNQAQRNQELIDRQNVFGDNTLDDDRLVNRDDLENNDQTSGLFERPIESGNTGQFEPSNNLIADSQLIDPNELDDSPTQLQPLDGNPLDTPIALNDGTLDSGERSPFADRDTIGQPIDDGSIRLDDPLPIDARDQELNSLIDPQDSIAESSIAQEEPRGIFDEPLDSSGDNSLAQVDGQFGEPLDSGDSSQLIDPNALDGTGQDLANTEITGNPFETQDSDPMTFEEPKTQGGFADLSLEERPSDIATPSLDDNIFENSNALENAAPIQQPALATVEPATEGTYVIQDGDSYWNISKKVYGTPKHFQALADYNKHLVKNPNRLKPKTSILTPSVATLTGKPESIAVARVVPPIGGDTTLTSSTQIVSNSEVGTTVRKPQIPEQGIFFNAQGHPMYRVGEKDTLTTIAAEHLGRWSRWRQIYRMNQDQLPDPNKLALKMILRLPADASTSPLVSKDREIR